MMSKTVLSALPDWGPSVADGETVILRLMAMVASFSSGEFRSKSGPVSDSEPTQRSGATDRTNECPKYVYKFRTRRVNQTAASGARSVG
jgi:hypothetical protein